MSRPLRRKKFIDVSVQGSLVRRIVFHWLVFLMVTAFVAFVLQVLSNPFMPLAEHVHNLSFTHGPLLMVMVFVLPVCVVDTIKLSHRFAGPIFALRRAMREVAQGRPPRKLSFRSNDFWHELADDYNAMLERLGANVDATNEVTYDEEPVGADEER